MVYADINSEVYGFPTDAGRKGLAGSQLWKQTAYAYIGYDNGKAVSTAAAIVNDDQLYLALVATRPDAQRKGGFGEASVRHALRSAYEATGITRATLHATDAGFPDYQRVGYHRTTKFMTYSIVDQIFVVTSGSDGTHLQVGAFDGRTSDAPASSHHRLNFNQHKDPAPCSRPNTAPLSRQPFLSSKAAAKR